MFRLAARLEKTRLNAARRAENKGLARQQRHENPQNQRPVRLCLDSEAGASHYAAASGKKPSLIQGTKGYTARTCGVVAQLGERRVRNAEVGSSILLGSTTRILDVVSV